MTNHYSHEEPEPTPEPTPPSRAEMLAEKAAERAKRLADTKAARFEGFLNAYNNDRFAAETTDRFFVPKDEIQESTVFWDGDDTQQQRS